MSILFKGLCNCRDKFVSRITHLPGNQLLAVAILLGACLILSCGGGGSDLNPVPALSSISPPTIIALSGDALVTVTGSGFTPQSTLTLNAVATTATLVSTNQLTTTLPARMLAQPNVFNITVSNPAPGGGTSPAKLLTVLAKGSVSSTNNPQVARYSFSSPRDASVTIEFGPDGNYGLRTWTLNTPPGGGPVDFLVAGMRANTTYHMRAIVDFPDRVQHLDADHTFTTGGLPPVRVPQVTVTRPHALTPNPGVELLNLTLGSTNQVMAVVTDIDGNLIWYYDFDPTGTAQEFPFPFKFLSNGNVLVNISPFLSTLPAPGERPNILREIDLAGNTIREVSIGDINQGLANAVPNLTVEPIHHDFAILPNGHIVVLVGHTKQFVDLAGYPGITSVIGDALVDLDENFNPVWVWDSFDHLDVNRHPMSFPDWTHSNALVYTPDDGNLILSIRHQHWVIKIDYQDGRGSGDILWRLGYQGDFTLQGGGPQDWFYAQHFPVITSPNTAGLFNLAVFDNGNNRVLDANGKVCGSPGAPDCYSRVALFSIDEINQTAQVVWADNLGVFAPFIGSVGLFQNGYIEIDIGAFSVSPPASRVLEWTQPMAPETVWQLDIEGQFAYRAFRIPSLYPGVEW